MCTRRCNSSGPGSPATPSTSGAGVAVPERGRSAGVHPKGLVGPALVVVGHEAVDSRLGTSIEANRRLRRRSRLRVGWNLPSRWWWGWRRLSGGGSLLPQDSARTTPPPARGKLPAGRGQARPILSHVQRFQAAYRPAQPAAVLSCVSAFIRHFHNRYSRGLPAGRRILFIPIEGLPPRSSEVRLGATSGKWTIEMRSGEA